MFVTLRDFLLIGWKDQPTPLSLKEENKNTESDDVGLKHLEDCAYQGRLALEATPRRLADIWLMLREIDSGKSQDQTANGDATK